MVHTEYFLLPDDAVDRRKLGFQFLLLNSSSRPQYNSLYIFNHAADRQHEQIINHLSLSQNENILFHSIFIIWYTRRYGPKLQRFNYCRCTCLDMSMNIPLYGSFPGKALVRFSLDSDQVVFEEDNFLIACVWCQGRIFSLW